MTAHDGERQRARISIGTNRRAFLKSAGVVGVAAASSFRMASPTRAESRTIKIGYIGAQSGVGANFGEATPWTVDRVRAAVKDGVKIGEKSYAVELVIKDNQSDPNRRQWSVASSCFAISAIWCSVSAEIRRPRPVSWPTRAACRRNATAPQIPIEAELKLLSQLG